MRTHGGRYGFLERHPEAFLIPSAVLFAFIAYLNLAKLATSHSAVGASWLASAAIGCACGIAVVAGIVIRLRAGKVDLAWLIPPVLVVAGLLVNKREVWAVPNPPGLVTTAFQNGTLALCGTLSVSVVALLGWFRVATAEKQKIARKASRVPVRDLHISRAENWRASAARPIDRGEWELFAEDHPALSHYDIFGEQAREDAIATIIQDTGVTRDQAVAQLRDREPAVQQAKAAMESRPDLAAKHPEVAQAHGGSTAPNPIFALTRPDGTRLLLQWRKSQVTALRVAQVAADAALILPMAQALDAHVYGESGTLLG